MPDAAGRLLLQRPARRGRAPGLVHHQHQLASATSLSLSRHLAAHPAPDPHARAWPTPSPRPTTARRAGVRRPAPSPPAWRWPGTPPTTAARVLRGSVSQYVDVDVNAIAGHTLGSQVQRRCRWNAGQPALRPGLRVLRRRSASTVGLPCGPTGFDAHGPALPAASWCCPRPGSTPSAAEREVVEGMAMGMDFIYRKYDNQYERLETNRVWNRAGNGLDPVGGYRNGRATTVSDLETPDGAYRRYVGRDRPRCPSAKATSSCAPRTPGASSTEPSWRATATATATSARATRSWTARWPTITGTRSRPNAHLPLHPLAVDLGLRY